MRKWKIWLPAAVILLSVPILLHPFLLPALGGIVFYDKSDFERVDTVVILGGSVPDRALAARDLLLSSRAGTALLSREVLSPQERSLRRLGIRLPSKDEINREILIRAGVQPERIDYLPGAADSTREEAEAFKRYLADHPVKSVALVTCRNHSYRAYLNFKKALEGTGVSVYVVPSSYCDWDPGAWWKDRDQIKVLYVELASLIAFFFGQS